MPRNSSGTYTLPAGNPVVPNTLIETTWANPTMSDLGSSITDSLDRQGRGAMLAALKLIDGTAVGPGLSFNSESTSGLYRIGSGNLGVSIAGSLVLAIAAAGVTVTGALTVGSLLVSPGTAALPGYSFAGDPNTGMSAQVADTLVLSTAGLARVTTGPAGNVAIAAPSSGAPLAVNHTAASQWLGAAGIAAAIEFAGNGNVAGTTSFFVGQDTSGLANLLVRANAALSIGTNSLARVTIAGAGNVVINAPSSGNALTVTAATGAQNTINNIAGAATTDYALDLFTGTGATGFVGVGNSAVANTALRDTMGIGTQTADPFAILTGNTARVTVAAAGNVAIVAPSSGNTLTVAVVSGGANLVLTDVAAGSIPSRIDGFATQSISRIETQRESSNIGGRLGLWTSNSSTGTLTERVVIGNLGNVTINSPSSGTALTVNAAPASGVSFAVASPVGTQAAFQINVSGQSAWTVYQPGGSNDLRFFNGADRITFASGGNVTFAVPTSGTAFSIVGLTGSAGLDITSAGIARAQLRSTAGNAAVLMLAGNNTSPGASSFDLQMDGGSAVDIVNRANTRMSFYTNALERLRIEADGRLYGTALHNNAGAVTGTTNQYIASGTWTPTLTNVANCGGISAPAGGSWVRVGNVVHCCINFGIQPTAAALAVTSVGISLPIASNLGPYDLNGTGVPFNTNTQLACGHVSADSTNDRAQMNFYAQQTGFQNAWAVHFQYTII